MQQHAKGTVSSISTHSNGTHAEISIKHGEDPKQTKNGPWIDPAPRSSVIVPKSRARQFSVGQKVKVAVMPAEGSAGEEDAEDAADEQQERASGTDSPPRSKKGKPFVRRKS